MKALLVMAVLSLSIASTASAITCSDGRFSAEVKSYETTTEFIQSVRVGCGSAGSARFVARHPIVDGEVLIDAARQMRFRALAATALAMLGLPERYEVTYSTLLNPNTGVTQLFAISSRISPDA
jgi:hypothetical protein